MRHYASFFKWVFSDLKPQERTCDASHLWACRSEHRPIRPPSLGCALRTIPYLHPFNSYLQALLCVCVCLCVSVCWSVCVCALGELALCHGQYSTLKAPFSRMNALHFLPPNFCIDSGEQGRLFREGSRDNEDNNESFQMPL